MKGEVIGYAIQNKETKEFLDIFNGEADCFKDAAVYHFIDSAMESLKERDMAHAYEVVKVKLNLEIIESEVEK